MEIPVRYVLIRRWEKPNVYNKCFKGMFWSQGEFPNDYVYKKQK